MCLSAQLLGRQASSSFPPPWRRSNFVTGVGWLAETGERKRAPRFSLPACPYNTYTYAKIRESTRARRSSSSSDPQITLHFHANIWWNWQPAISLSRGLFLAPRRVERVSRPFLQCSRVSRWVRKPRSDDYNREDTETGLTKYEPLSGWKSIGDFPVVRRFLASMPFVSIRFLPSMELIAPDRAAWRRRDLETWQLSDCERSSSQSVPLSRGGKLNAFTRRSGTSMTHLLFSDPQRSLKKGTSPRFFRQLERLTSIIFKDDWNFLITGEARVREIF